jgi:hypothetical protein
MINRLLSALERIFGSFLENDNNLQISLDFLVYL